MLPKALERDITRLGVAAEKLLLLKGLSSTGTLQRGTLIPKSGEAVIEQINSGEVRMIVQCGDRPRRRFWIAGTLESK